MTSSLTPAARNAAHRAARDLARRLAPLFEAEPYDIVFADGKVMVRDKPDTAMPFKKAVQEAEIGEISHRVERPDDYEGYLAAGNFGMRISRYGIGGVQFAQVAVDTETGVVKVERIVAAHDCGRPINPKLAESQIYGGVIQGISYALYEERHLDPGSGHQLNANIDQYKMVGSRETLARSVVEGVGDGGSGGDVGWFGDAAGVSRGLRPQLLQQENLDLRRIRTLPMTPANVLAALRA